MQITVQAFGWRMIIERVDPPRPRRAKPERAALPESRETTESRLRRAETAAAIREERKRVSIFKGSML